MEHVLRRVAAMLSRAVGEVVDVSKKCKTVQVSVCGGVRPDGDAGVAVDTAARETRDGVEVFEPYGFTSAEPVGAEYFLANVGGTSDHSVAVNSTDRRYRPVDLASEDVAVYDKRGNRVHLKSTGVFVVAVLADVSGNLIVHGTVTATAVTAVGALSFGSLSGGGGISGSGGAIDAVAYKVAGAAGASGTFTTTDGKTVTVVNGIVTGIV